MTLLDRESWRPPGDHAVTGSDVQPDAATAEIELDDLRLTASRRTAGIDSAHVAALKELAGDWPPIVVSATDRSVIDGLHRVHAALALGLSRLPCVFFVGAEDDAYAEFVRRNTTHGLPLTLREREGAARHILGRRPEWSDRRLAAVCGLSAGTVARLRHELSGEVEEPRCATDEDVQLHARVGRDGRRRPVDRQAIRARIAEALEKNPRASLRAVAAIVGTSPTTVRSVQSELARAAAHGGAVPGAQADVAAPWPDLGHPVDAWVPDAAVLSTDEGSAFAEWFSRTAVGDDWWQHLATVPLSRVYDVADEARRRAQHWSDFARALEAKSRRR